MLVISTILYGFLGKLRAIIHRTKRVNVRHTFPSLKRQSSKTEERIILTFQELSRPRVSFLRTRWLFRIYSFEVVFINFIEEIYFHVIVLEIRLCFPWMSCLEFLSTKSLKSEVIAPVYNSLCIWRKLLGLTPHVRWQSWWP